MPKPDPKPIVVSKKKHPLSGYGVHMGGFLSGPNGYQSYVLVLSQNGQKISDVTDKELSKSGYTLDYRSPCHSVLKWEDTEINVICDQPKVGVSSLTPGLSNK